MDCGNLTAKETEEIIRKNVEDYSLELLFKEDKKETIQGSEIAYQYVRMEVLRNYRKNRIPSCG